LSLSDLFSRRRKDDTDAADVVGDVPAHPTKALPGFLNALSNRSQSLLLDLGPVVGANVNFFSEELPCKILMEDLFEDLERHITEGKLDQFPAFLETRFEQGEATVDGILCWDIFDYLDRQAAEALARQLKRILRPDGVLFAQFSAGETPKGVSRYIRYVVVDRKSLQYRHYGAMRDKQRPLANRDIQRLFEPLRITDQFLLKSNQRELLFRKPVVTASDGSDTPDSPTLASGTRASASVNSGKK